MERGLTRIWWTDLYTYKKCGGQSGVGWRGVKPGYGGQIYIHIKSVEVSQG